MKMFFAVLSIVLFVGCKGTPNDEVTTTMTSGDEEAFDEINEAPDDDSADSEEQ